MATTVARTRGGSAVAEAVAEAEQRVGGVEGNVTTALLDGMGGGWQVERKSALRHRFAECDLGEGSSAASVAHQKSRGASGDLGDDCRPFQVKIDDGRNGREERLQPLDLSRSELQ